MELKMKYAIVCEHYVLTVGERYKVVRPIIFAIGPIKESTFYGTCNSITPSPMFHKFLRVQFIDVEDHLNEPIQYHKILTVDIISIRPNDWRFMKLMEPKLTIEIKRYNKMKIPSLANLCRKYIPYDTHVEYQGTYINDLIVGNL
jgi:hypothetical protein